jgi:hypothetical protein
MERVIERIFDQRGRAMAPPVSPSVPLASTDIGSLRIENTR